MGREIRMVPPNWEHPKQEDRPDQYKPMYESSYAVARQEWLEGLAAHKPEEHDGCDYWEWEGNPPNREYYVPYIAEEATWFQVYETVSEGTPVTPPFATRGELVDYLVDNGDFWDQSRHASGALMDIWGRTSPKWSRENAEAFVKSSRAPSMFSVNGVMRDASQMSELCKEGTNGNNSQQ